MAKPNSFILKKYFQDDNLPRSTIDTQLFTPRCRRPQLILKDFWRPIWSQGNTKCYNKLGQH